MKGLLIDILLTFLVVGCMMLLGFIMVSFPRQFLLGAIVLILFGAVRTIRSTQND
jgi:hypothetical protein